jgi:hypothetical protein
VGASLLLETFSQAMLRELVHGGGGGLMDNFCKQKSSLYLTEEMNQSILFEDIFEIKALNENGKKFERGAIDNVEAAARLTLTHCDLLLYVVTVFFTVNRLHCKGTTFDVDFVVGEFLCIAVLSQGADSYFYFRPRLGFTQMSTPSFST